MVVLGQAEEGDTSAQEPVLRPQSVPSPAQSFSRFSGIVFFNNLLSR